MDSAIRIAVIGAHGQVSTAIQEAARSRRGEFEITVLGRPHLDLEQPETIRTALAQAAPQIVVNAAAYTAVDQAEEDVDRARRINAVGPGVLAEETARRGIPILHFSTDYVFDGTKPSPYGERDTPNPRGVYGATKLEGERYVAEANPEHFILRTAWVYGPHGSNFVRTMIRLAETRPQVSVVADQVGNPTYSLDIAEGVLAVSGQLGQGRTAPPGVYHMAGADDISWAALAQATFDALRRRGKPAAQVLPIGSADYPTRAVRPKNSRLDCAKLMAQFGVALPGWTTGLDRCLDHLYARV